MSPFDLHVLSTPPAFILSQDQTLRNKTPFGVKSTELLVLLETTGHRLPITLQLLRCCCQPEARFYFLLLPLSRGDKNTDDTLFAGRHRPVSLTLSFVIDLPLKAKSSTHLGALL